MQNLNNLNNLNALGIKGNNLFNPSSITVNGERTLLQQLLTKQVPTIDGVVYDERTNKGTARPIQLGRCYLFDGTNDYVATPVIPSTSGSIEVEFIKGASTNKFLGGARDSTDTRCILGYDSLNKPIGGIGSVSGTTIIGTTTLVTGTKYILKLTWNGSFVFLYVNGVLEYSGTQVGSVGTVQPIYFGTFNDAGTPSGAYASDKVLTFKIYNGSTLQNFYKCDEQNGTIAYDSSGNNAHGTIINATLATFHSTQDVYSWQNEVGHSLGTSLSPSGGTLWLMGGSSVNSYSGDILMKTRITDVVGYSFIYFATGTTINNPISSLGTHWIYLRNGILRTQSRTDVELTHGAFAIGDEIEIRRIGTTVAVYKNNVLVRTFTNSSTGALYVCASIHSDSSSESGIVTINSVYEIFNLVALTARKTYYIPRNESIPTQDVLGNTLTYTGQVPYNGLLKGSNCVDLDGTNDYITANVALDILKNSSNSFKIKWKGIFDSVSGARRLAGQMEASGNYRGVLLYSSNTSLVFTIINTLSTNQLRVDAGGLTLETGKYYEIEVSYNGSKSTSGVSWLINGVVYTASPIVNTLTDNNVDSGTNFFISDSAFFDGKIMHTEVLNGSNVSQIRYTMAEGSGLTVYDSSGNSRHGTLTNGVVWSTQNNYHANIVNGFGSYIEYNGADDYAITGLNMNTFCKDTFSVDTIVSPTDGQSVTSSIFGSSDNATFGTQGADSNNGLGIYVLSTGKLAVLYKAGGNFARADTANVIFADGAITTPRKFRFTLTAGSGITILEYINGAWVNLALDATNNGLFSTNSVVMSTFNYNNNAGIATKLTGTTPYTFYGGKVFDVDITNSVGVSYATYKGDEVRGTVAYDSSGNGLNGTIIGTPPRTLVPALNSTTDVFGYPLTNPAGAYHNGAETTIDFTGGVASPVAVINSWETAWAFNTARTNPEFKRTLTSGGVDHRADRFLAYRDALSGTNLSKVNKYVTTKAI